MLLAVTGLVLASRGARAAMATAAAERRRQRQPHDGSGGGDGDGSSGRGGGSGGGGNGDSSDGGGGDFEALFRNAPRPQFTAWQLYIWWKASIIWPSNIYERSRID